MKSILPLTIVILLLAGCSPASPPPPKPAAAAQPATPTAQQPKHNGEQELRNSLKHTNPPPKHK